MNLKVNFDQLMFFKYKDKIVHTNALNTNPKPNPLIQITHKKSLSISE